MVGPSMADAEKVAALREALPAANAGIYLNTPLAGPLPAESAAAMAEVAVWEVRTGRAHRDRAEDVAVRLEEARAAVAAILTVDLDDVDLAHGIDDAFSRAIRLAPVPAGGRVAVVADAVTGRVASLLPVGVETVPLDPATPDVVPAGTDLVVAPLVLAGTGERVAVERLAAAASAVGARLVVDGSLVLGAAPLDPAILASAIVVARAEAWLLGPEGLAVVAGDGLRAAEATPGSPAAGFHLPSVAGLARGCGWLSMYVGLPWIHERGAALTARVADALSAIPGVTLLTPAARATTLVFTIEGWPAREVLDELGSRIFLLAGALDDADAIRIGISFWNTAEELDRLVEGVDLLARHTPDTLPRRPGLTILGEA